jgi:hypothetical protein
MVPTGTQCRTSFCWRCLADYKDIPCTGHNAGCVYAMPGAVDPHNFPMPAMNARPVPPLQPGAAAQAGAALPAGRMFGGIRALGQLIMGANRGGANRGGARDD